jgi:hypothetical protein
MKPVPMCSVCGRSPNVSSQARYGLTALVDAGAKMAPGIDKSRMFSTRASAS